MRVLKEVKTRMACYETCVIKVSFLLSAQPHHSEKGSNVIFFLWTNAGFYIQEAFPKTGLGKKNWNLPRHDGQKLKKRRRINQTHKLRKHVIYAEASSGSSVNINLSSLPSSSPHVAAPRWWFFIFIHFFILLLLFVVVVVFLLLLLVVVVMVVVVLLLFVVL